MFRTSTWFDAGDQRSRPADIEVASQNCCAAAIPQAPDKLVTPAEHRIPQTLFMSAVGGIVRLTDTEGTATMITTLVGGLIAITGAGASLMMIISGRGMRAAAGPALIAVLAGVMVPLSVDLVKSIAPAPDHHATAQHDTLGGFINGLLGGPGKSDDPASSPASPTPAPAPPPPPKPAPPQSTPAPTQTSVSSTAIFIVLASIAGVVALAVLTGKGISFVGSRRQLAEERTARRQQQIDRWTNGLSTMNATAEALMAFEVDPEAVYFTRPLLADTTEPASARFYTAFATAQTLKLENIPTDDDAITAFVNAATEAQQAFNAADENARRKARVGVSSNDRTLSATDKRKVDQARKLMATATNPAASPNEADVAHRKALELLDAVGTIIPERLVTKVTRQLETVRRQAITA